MEVSRTNKSVSNALSEIVLVLVLAPAYLIGAMVAGLLGVAFSWQVAITLLVTAFVGASLDVTVG
jgi:hypothetical protein